MTLPVIFISYSHQDEKWKNRLVTHLGVLEDAGVLNFWDDRQIGVGEDWYAEIEQAINKATIAILLVTANFLTSKFILNEEIPRLLQRRDKKGLKIFPVIVKPCPWQEVKWLARMQVRPKDGRPVSAGRAHQIETDLASIASEIARLVKRAAPITPKSYPLIGPDRISTAKLPSTDSTLFGREEELKAFDDLWNNQIINVLSLVAWGGVGKTALVNKWLLQMAKDNYRGAERVYGWSFYSQGASEGRHVSADQFIASALTWFGDPQMANSSALPWDKGERLAELIKQQRTLLILDGLEPLQNPPPVETGRIKDPGLTSLLRELARENSGLVVITTRLSVDDLKDFIIRPSLQGRDKEGSAFEIDLENLSPDAGAALLKYLGVDGTDGERKEAAKDFAGHALALTLMGSYLKVVHSGDIRKRKEIPHVMDEQKQGAHARRVIASYERWLQGKPELDILCLMGIFDRPAEKGALNALRKEPAIEGLTDALQKLSDAEWRYAVNNLCKLRLLAEPDPHEPDTLDCHPLLREHFGEKLKAETPEAWQEAHSRLYEYYGANAKELPNTIEEMAPLFAAVIHGCEARRYQETLDEVFWNRIRRGEESFSWRQLGAFGADLTALAGFFTALWLKPVDGLTESDKAFVLGEAGFDLRSLGRLEDALQLQQASLEAHIAQEDWIDAAITAGIVSEIYLILGNIAQALVYASQSVDLADRTTDRVRAVKRATLADVLHQNGRTLDAEVYFREAEKLQREMQPEYPYLYSLRGFQFCDLLLSQERAKEVQQRASQTINIARREKRLLDIALDNLSLGRAYWQIQQASNYQSTKSEKFLNRAVEGLRKAGMQAFLVRGLLARAEYYDLTGALEKAIRNLDEAFTIATRGRMGLHLADCHLEYARLNFSTFKRSNVQTKLDKARKHLATAKEMIAKMGYHRMDKGVMELEEQLR